MKNAKAGKRLLARETLQKTFGPFDEPVKKTHLVASFIELTDDISSWRIVCDRGQVSTEGRRSVNRVSSYNIPTRRRNIRNLVQHTSTT